MNRAYTAVIRAHTRNDLLHRLIVALRAQTLPPSKIIIVDSSPDRAAFIGLDDATLEIVTYPDTEFNFSKAINIGLARSETDNTLIISSHIELSDAGVIERGLQLARQHGVEMFYWAPAVPPSVPEVAVAIDRRTFNGTNGLCNSISMVKTELCIERPFREEVFSAEDQEWAAHYFRERGGRILRISSPQVGYANPNHGSATWSELKVFNEQLALGHFVHRRFIYPDRILARALRGALALSRGRRDRARMHFRFAWAMTKANFVRPVVQSRYF
ncbi:MAG: glycosyltransferase [Erythrobacter sp.]|nr:glycosyltransferase [Erythrobacter sp.]